MNRFRGFASTVVLGALMGCGDGGAPEWEGTIDTLSNGAISVTNRGPGVWERDGMAATWVEELRIGRLDGDGPELFGSISDLETDESGRIYVLEDDASELRVFGADGAHQFTVGREGEGPGEFNRPSSLLWAIDGRLWVAEPLNRRFSLFTADGEFIETRIQQSNRISLPWRGGFGPAGTIREVSESRIDEFTEMLGPVDSLDLAEVESPTFELSMTLGGNQIMMTQRVPFGPSRVTQVDAGGEPWLAVTDVYALHQVALSGDTMRVVRREDAGRLPVTGADLDQARERLSSFIESGADLDFSKIPDEKPYFSDFTFADDGTLWVELETEAEFEGGRYDLFDREGRYLGRLETPYELRRPKIRGGFVYASVRDELDVPYVVRARLELTSAAPE